MSRTSSPVDPNDVQVELLRVLSERIEVGAVSAAVNLLRALADDPAAKDAPAKVAAVIENAIRQSRGRAGEALRAMVGLHPNYPGAAAVKGHRTSASLAVGEILDSRQEAKLAAGKNPSGQKEKPGYSLRTAEELERDILAPALAVQLGLIDKWTVSAAVRLAMQPRLGDTEAPNESLLLRNLGRHLVTGWSAPLLREVDQATIEGQVLPESVAPDIPYIPRPSVDYKLDECLARADRARASEDRIVVVEGLPKSGKTRSTLEALLRFSAFADRSVLILRAPSQATPARADALADDLRAAVDADLLDPHRLIVIIDDLQRHLGHGAINFASIRRIAVQGAIVVVLITDFGDGWSREHLSTLGLVPDDVSPLLRKAITVPSELEDSELALAFEMLGESHDVPHEQSELLRPLAEFLSSVPAIIDRLAAWEAAPDRVSQVAALMADVCFLELGLVFSGQGIPQDVLFDRTSDWWLDIYPTRRPLSRSILEESLEKLTTPVAKYYAALMPGTGALDMWQPHDGVLRRNLLARHEMREFGLTEGTLRLLESGRYPDALAWTTAYFTVHGSEHSGRLLQASRSEKISEPFVAVGQMLFDANDWPRCFEYASIAAELGDPYGMMLAACAKGCEEDYCEALRFAEMAYGAGLLYSAGIAGAACYWLARYPEAESWLRKAIEHDPNDFKSHWLLGKVLSPRDQLGEAKEHIKKAADLGYLEARALAGYAAYEDGNFIEAIAYLEKVPDLETNCEALYCLAWALGMAKQGSKGLSYARKAAALGYEPALAFATDYEMMLRKAHNQNSDI